MAIKGLQILYNLILKDVVKGSGKASGIMSIGGDVRKLADKKLQNYITAAQKQGVDLDSLSEQELKYIIQLNKPKPLKAIPADSPEGQGITKDLFNMLDRQSGKNVIKTDFGRPFAEEVVTVESVVTDIKKLDPIESMKEANKVLKGEGRYKSLSEADRKKIATDESVTDHIFEREIKPDPEDLAEGGRTGLSYLLAEDTNERVPFGAGGIDKVRRLFLQAMGAGAAGVGAAKSGLFGLLKGGAKKEAIKELTQVPIKDISGMPSWFKPLVNKVIKEGTEIDSGAARVITHKTKLPNSKTDVYVTQELDTGNVAAEIGSGKHGFADGKFGQPVRLEYKASEVIEPSYTKEGDYFKGHKTKEEFNVEEAEFTGGHPENVKFEETTIEKFGEHASDFSEVEKFAIGKNTVKSQFGTFNPTKIKKASGGLTTMLGE